LRKNWLPPLLLALPLAGCEIRSVALTEPDDVVVAEAFLRAGAPTQYLLLHRTGGRRDVAGADVEVRDSRGGVLRFVEQPDATACLLREDSTTVSRVATCYAAESAPAAPGIGFGDSSEPVAAGTSAMEIRPGETYSLRITTADARVLTATTTVPGSFHVVRPSPAAARCLARDPFEIAWKPADGAWVYLAEADLYGLRAALAPRGITVERDPLRLVGLAISRNDTTIAFPGEFGIFDRFDLRDILVALQGGLPDGVRADIMIAAADRNYVNWVRGGNFNPSGAIRVPSIRGNGTGVFGSLNLVRFEVFTSGPGLPSCDEA